MRALVRAAAAAMFLVGGILVGVPAWAHHAPSGWNYPPGCCGKYDCAVLLPGDVKWSPEGWHVVATGEVISFEEAQPSGDLDWHRCRKNPRKHDSATRTSTKNGRPCLYVPAAEN